MPRLRFGLPPAEFLRGGFERLPQACIREVPKPEIERVHLGQVREFIHEGLACEMVGRCGERAIRTLAQRRLGGMKLNALIRNIVERADGRRAGVVIVELPGGDRAIAALRPRKLR